MTSVREWYRTHRIWWLGPFVFTALVLGLLAWASYCGPLPLEPIE